MKLLAYADGPSEANKAGPRHIAHVIELFNIECRWVGGKVSRVVDSYAWLAKYDIHHLSLPVYQSLKECTPRNLSIPFLRWANELILNGVNMEEALKQDFPVFYVQFTKQVMHIAESIGVEDDWLDRYHKRTASSLANRTTQVTPCEMLCSIEMDTPMDEDGEEDNNDSSMTDAGSPDQKKRGRSASSEPPSGEERRRKKAHLSDSFEREDGNEW